MSTRASAFANGPTAGDGPPDALFGEHCADVSQAWIDCYHCAVFLAVARRTAISKVFLVADPIRLAQPGAKFIIDVGLGYQAEYVDVISSGEGLDSSKSR